MLHAFQNFSENNLFLYLCEKFSSTDVDFLKKID